jgi:hypothetical protein
MFATDDDLVKYIPTIFDHGVETFTSELSEAEDDVLRYIQINWFNKRSPGSTMDPTLLTTSQWTRSTVYLALANFILPQLSTFRPEGDSFREQIAFYKERYNEEVRQEILKGVEYDSNDDGTVQTSEKRPTNLRRLVR